MGFSLNAYAGAAAGGEFILQPGVSAGSSGHVGLFAPVGLDLAFGVSSPSERRAAPTRAGATFTTITRDAFRARLAALVPPPGFHMVRYYGVLSGRHHLRELVQPESVPEGPQPQQLPLFIAHRDAELPAITTTPGA